MLALLQPFLGFITGPVGRWLVAALAVLSLLFAVHHHGYNKGLAKERAKADIAIAALNTRLNVCHGNVDALNAAVTRQNGAVAALKAESDKRSAEAAKALTAARKATTAANQRVGAILAAKPGTDQCASAEALIGSVVQ